jgi:hypothetical protein
MKGGADDTTTTDTTDMSSEATKDIVDGYMNMRGHLIIYISVLSGLGTHNIIKTLRDDLNMDVLNEKDYYKMNELTDFKLPNGKKVKNIYDVNIVDWDKLNKYIRDIGGVNRGVIVIGTMFPKDKATKPDFHIHLKMSIEDLIKRREEFVKTHPNNFGNIDKTDIKIIYDSIEGAFYKNIITDSIINKFINISGKTDEEIIDILFNEIIHFIESVVYK